MATTDGGPDSDAATVIEIKGGSLVSFAPSVRNIDENDAKLDASEAGKPTGQQLESSRSATSSKTSIAKSAIHGDTSTTLPNSKSRSRVTIATTSTLTGARHRRSVHRLGTVSMIDTATDGEGIRPGPSGDANDVRTPNLRTEMQSKIPEGMAKLLRELPEPRDLAPLVRSVIISADKPARQALHFKSVTKVQRIGFKPAVQVARAARVRIARKRQIGGAVMYEPTYWLGPKEVPNWRNVRKIMKEVLTDALEGVTYSTFLAESGCRILAACMVQQIKKQNYERYRLAAKVRIFQKMNQGVATHVACMWDSNVDRFSYVQFENASVAAQAILFLVYRD